MSKVSNFSDLIQRVTASCLLHPLAIDRHDSGELTLNPTRDDEDFYELERGEREVKEEDEEKEEQKVEGGNENRVWEGKREMELVMVMTQVFDSVSSMKKAYLSLQEAHSPWDPEKIRVADAAMVAVMKKLGVLRERFRRTCGGRVTSMVETTTVREIVAPYEATVEELKRDVKAKEMEVENLKEKLNSLASFTSKTGGKKGKSLSFSKRKISSFQTIAMAPSPELFDSTMCQVKECSKFFTSLLLSLMRSAHWDITAAVRSIESATAAIDNTFALTSTSSTVTTKHAKYALESYISGKIFQGFDHETFYMDGSLSSLLNPDQFRRDCFAQYRDMKAMDPSELLGVLPTCHFGKFCSKKYLAIVHPKMEESLFGDLEQHRQVSAGNHPRSEFYGEFLELAKSVWLLHLLAFSIDPPPSQFEASRGAEFHPQYMESVVKFSGGRVPSGQVVGLSVSPGFKLRNGSVVKARVYLVSRN